MITIGPRRSFSPFDSAVVKDIRSDGVEFAFTRDNQENEFVKVPHGAEGLIVSVDGMDQVIRPVPRRTIQPLVASASDSPLPVPFCATHPS